LRWNMMGEKTWDGDFGGNECFQKRKGGGKREGKKGNKTEDKVRGVKGKSLTKHAQSHLNFGRKEVDKTTQIRSYEERGKVEPISQKIIRRTNLKKVTT